MTLPRRLVRSLALVGALLAVAGGAASGVALANRANVPGHEELVLIDPSSVVVETVGLRSAAGFTGFDGEGALAGQVTRAGTLSAPANGAIEVTSAGSSLTVRTTSNERLFRIAAASAPLRAGDLVQVRVEGDAARGVLRLPADLHERGRAVPTATGTPR